MTEHSQLKRGQKSVEIGHAVDNDGFAIDHELL
jgi:hypothetical protein